MLAGVGRNVIVIKSWFTPHESSFDSQSESKPVSSSVLLLEALDNWGDSEIFWMTRSAVCSRCAWHFWLLHCLRSLILLHGQLWMQCCASQHQKTILSLSSIFVMACHTCEIVLNQCASMFDLIVVCRVVFALSWSDSQLWRWLHCTHGHFCWPLGSV